MQVVPAQVTFGMSVRAPIEFPWVLDTAPSRVAVISPFCAGPEREKEMPC